MILGGERKADAEYLDVCRIKRNRAEYDQVGVVSAAEAGELIDFVLELRPAVIAWLKANRVDLLGG